MANLLDKLENIKMIKDYIRWRAGAEGFSAEALKIDVSASMERPEYKVNLEYGGFGSQYTIHEDDNYKAPTWCSVETIKALRDLNHYILAHAAKAAPKPEEPPEPIEEKHVTFAALKEFEAAMHNQLAQIEREMGFESGRVQVTSAQRNEDDSGTWRLAALHPSTGSKCLATIHFTAVDIRYLQRNPHDLEHLAKKKLQEAIDSIRWEILNVRPEAPD